MPQGVQLRWLAWMPRWWIVINYHQEELSGWCNTDLGISRRLTQNFLRFLSSALAVDMGKADFWQHDVPRLQHLTKLHCVTLNIVGQIKKSPHSKKMFVIFMTGYFSRVSPDSVIHWMAPMFTVEYLKQMCPVSSAGYLSVMVCFTLCTTVQFP